MSSGKGSAGGGGRSKGGKGSATGTVAAVAGTLGASAAPAAAQAAPAAAAPVAQAAKAAVSTAPIKPGEFNATNAPGLAERSAAIAAHTGADTDKVMAAIDKVAAREPENAMLLVEDVRKQAGLSKSAFDKAALDLSTSDRTMLHYHDIPSSVSPEKRAQWVVDSEGTHYIGIARRRGTILKDGD